LNGKERVMAAFQHQQTDVVPVCHIGFSSDIASMLLGREAYVGGGSQQWREARALWQGKDAHQEFLERSFRDAIDVALAVDNDLVRPSYWRYPSQPTRQLDEYTYLYEHGDESNWKVLNYDPVTEQTHIVDYVSKQSAEDLEAVVEAEEKEIEDYQPSEDRFAFEIKAQRLIGHERVIRVGSGSVGIPYRQLWLEATLLRPDLVRRHLVVQVERAARNIPFLASHGFRLFFAGIDFAGNDGPMYSPKTFASLFLPALQQVSEICHKHGGYHLFASDGNIWPVAGVLFGTGGIDGYYEIDRRAGMDLESLREQFPALVLLGNVSSHTVHLGTKQEVIAEAMSCLEFAKRTTGVIAGTSNYFVPHTPIENVIALIETIRAHR
jgi:uroporphyrinogen decarboxylase-like protein